METPLEFLVKYGPTGRGTSTHEKDCARGAHMFDMEGYDWDHCAQCGVLICKSLCEGMGCTREAGHLGRHENRHPPFMRFVEGTGCSEAVGRPFWRWD